PIVQGVNLRGVTTVEHWALCQGTLLLLRGKVPVGVDRVHDCLGPDLHASPVARQSSVNNTSARPRGAGSAAGRTENGGLRPAGCKGFSWRLLSNDGPRRVALGARERIIESGSVSTSGPAPRPPARRRAQRVPSPEDVPPPAGVRSLRRYTSLI